MNFNRLVKKEVGMNVDILLADDIPNDDIRRVVKKMLQEVTLESMSAVARTIDISGVLPSTLDIIACTRIMNNYVKKNSTLRHPKYSLDVLREDYHVICQDTGITLVKEIEEEPIITIKSEQKADKPEADKVIRNRMGVLAEGTLDVQFAAASTLVAYYTRENPEKGSIERTFADDHRARTVGIPLIDLTRARQFNETKVASSVISQNLLYEKCKLDVPAGVAFVDVVYSKAPVYASKSAENARVVDVYMRRETAKLRKNYTGKSEGYIPCSFSLNYDSVADQIKTNLSAVHMMSIQSQGVRGGDNKGIGALTASYYDYEKPQNYVKATSRLRELMKMTELLGVQVVRIPGGKEFNSLTIELLVANGISVISDAGIGQYKKGDPAGHYCTTSDLTLRVVKNPIASPTYLKETGVTLNTTDFDKRISVLLSSEFTADVIATLTYLTPQVISFVEKNKFLFYPSLSPHACKIWIINKYSDLLKNNLTPDDHMRRMYNSILSRNMWPLIRRSFYNDDPHRNFFATKYLIPKFVRKADKKEEKFIYISVLSKVENCELIPSEVDSILAIEVEKDESVRTKMIYENKYAMNQDITEFFAKVYEDDAICTKAMELMRKDAKCKQLVGDFEAYALDRAKAVQTGIVKGIIYEDNNIGDDDKFIPPPDEEDELTRALAQANAGVTHVKAEGKTAANK